MSLLPRSPGPHPPDALEVLYNGTYQSNQLQLFARVHKTGPNTRNILDKALVITIM